MENLMKEVSSEDPNHHWKYVNVSGKRVLDLGCGDHGNATTLPYPTTLEYFLERGASFVVGIDLDGEDVRALRAKAPSGRAHIEHITVDSAESITRLIAGYNIDIVKCDIEGGEVHLLSLDEVTFRSAEQYYIETHGPELYSQCIAKLAECAYTIYEQINLVHTEDWCKVIFAARK
jgi:hypothetical protein